jgi:hypothetical protein
LRLFNASSIKTQLKSLVNYILSILLISAEKRLSADELHTEVTGPAAVDEFEPAVGRHGTLDESRSNGNFCRNSKRQAGFLRASPEKYENEKFPVDAFWQKAYRPAHNSTNQLFSNNNLTTEFVLFDGTR